MGQKTPPFAYAKRRGRNREEANTVTEGTRPPQLCQRFFRKKRVVPWQLRLATRGVRATSHDWRGIANFAVHELYASQLPSYGRNVEFLEDEMCRPCVSFRIMGSSFLNRTFLAEPPTFPLACPFRTR
jgi:hypothetical protein